MVLLANAPSLFSHVIMPTVSVATAIGMITAGIVLGVVVSRQLADTTVVLQSEVTLVLNRDLQQNELALFYNPLGTVDIVLESVQEILKSNFEDNFVNLELIAFSPTLEITSNNTNNSNTNTDKPNTNMDEHFEPYPKPSPSTVTSKERYHMILRNKCSRIIQSNYFSSIIVNTSYYKAKSHMTTMQPSPISTTGTTKRNTTWRSTTTTTITHANMTNCNYSANGTTKSSILRSKMYLYFSTSISQIVQVADIVAALKQLQPPLTVYTVYHNSSTNSSSYNSTLSKVEPPIQVDLDLEAIANQPAASSALLTAIDNSALQAELQLGITRNATNGSRTMYG